MFSEWKLQADCRFPKVRQSISTFVFFAASEIAVNFYGGLALARCQAGAAGPDCFAAANHSSGSVSSIIEPLIYESVGLP